MCTRQDNFNEWRNHFHISQCSNVRWLANRPWEICQNFPRESKGRFLFFEVSFIFVVWLVAFKICVTSHGPIEQNLAIANLLYIVSWSSSFVRSEQNCNPHKRVSENLRRLWNYGWCCSTLSDEFIFHVALVFQNNFASDAIN